MKPPTGGNSVYLSDYLYIYEQTFTRSQDFPALEYFAAQMYVFSARVGYYVIIVSKSGYHHGSNVFFLGVLSNPVVT